MKKTISLMMLMALGAGAWAQHPARSDGANVTILNHSSSSTPDTIIEKVFIENAPKAYNAPAVPSFAIEGKKGRFYLGLGGVAKATVSYDWGNPIDNGFDFTTSAIPMNLSKGNGGLTQFSAASSGLFLNFVALPGDKNQLGVYIDFNLTGADYGFDLQYAYIKFRGITAGYNYSLFSDMAAAPPSIDNEGPCGFTAIPNGVLDYEYTINPHWTVAIGAEMPMLSATYGDKAYQVNQRIPDIPLYAQYSWGGGANWLRASAILRNLQYRDVEADRNRDCFGWGVKVSGSSSLLPAVRAYWQAAYGKGITSYFQDLYEGGLDMVPDGANSSRMKAVEAWGGYIGLQYTLTPKLFATTTYSHLRNYADNYTGGSTPWGEQYKYAQYALANLIYSITPRVQCGVEYLYGRRVDHNGLSRHDNRIQAMLQVTF